MFKNYLRVAIRNMLRHKVFSSINIVGLAIGMSFAILILVWVRFESSFDRFNSNIDHLYRVGFYTEGREFYGDFVSGAIAGYLREEYPEIEKATRFSSREGWEFVLDGEKFVEYGRMVDRDFFDMFDVEVVRGSTRDALVDPYSVVITESMALRIFGDEDPVGKAMQVTPTISLIVAAVVRDVPVNSDMKYSFLASIALGGHMYEKWDVKCVPVYVMLSEGADTDAVNSKIIDAYNDHVAQDTKNNIFLSPLSRMHLHGVSGKGETFKYIVIFSIVAGAVLLIACINFMNLATARAETRLKEIAVKKVLGAARRQLASQFFVESLLYSFLAFFVAVIVVELLIPSLNSFHDLGVSLDLSWSMIALLGAVVLVTGLVSGSYPAVYLSSFRPSDAFRKERSYKFLSLGRRIRIGGKLQPAVFRKVLVVSQFTISIIFIISMLVIRMQIDHMRTMDLGFDSERILILDVPRDLRGRTELLKEQLAAHPDIEKVSISRYSLVRWNASLGFAWEGRTEDQPLFDTGVNSVDHDYLETFGIELAEGRFFSKEHSTDRDEACVVNEAAVRAMGITEPVGRMITMAPNSSIERKKRIIGVVKDYNTESAHGEIRPFILELGERGRYMCVRTSGGDALGALGHVRETVASISPDSNVWCRYFDEEVRRLYTTEMITGRVVSWITFIAVAISCLGLFGLAAFTAERKTREIGVRKVLGATEASIVRLMFGEFSVLVLISSLVACPASFLIMRKWLQNYAFRTTISPLVFLSVTIMALVLAGLTVSFQAVRAARLDPAKVLKHE